MFIYRGIGFRIMEKSDLELLRNLRNDQSTWENLTSVEFISTGQQENWYESMQSSKVDESYTVFNPINQGEILGRIRVDCIDRINRSIRVGVDILPDKRNMGWGKKTYNALLYYLFMHQGFHRIWLFCSDYNSHAKNLYLRLGFKEEGRLREAIWRNGTWNDLIVMALLEDGYRK